MGSGKTTMGKLIAEELHLPFVDTDEVLSEQEGMSCSDIICQKGQAYFRQQERNLLNSLPQNKGMVVATGGGMPCFLDNISLITSIGISLFLDWSVENLAIRLSLTDLSTRPMLLGKSGEELRAHIQKQLTERKKDKANVSENKIGSLKRSQCRYNSFLYNHAATTRAATRIARSAKITMTIPTTLITPI